MNKRKYIIIGIIVLVLAFIAARFLFNIAMKYLPGSDPRCWTGYYSSYQEDSNYQTNSNG